MPIDLFICRKSGPAVLSVTFRMLKLIIYRLNITIGQDTRPHNSDHSSSSLTDGEDSSGTSVQESPTSVVESQEYSESLEESESWVVYPDEIGPSDSASRHQTSNQHRPVVEAPRAQSARRQPPHRQVTHDRVHHRPHPRAPRAPPISPESLDPNEDWPGYTRGLPQHHGRAYAPWAHVAANSSPNFTPTYSSGQPYSPFPNTSAGQQLVPFANPIGGYGFPPFQPPTQASAPGYFAPGHQNAAIANPIAPHNSTSYGGQDMIHHAPSGAFYPYNHQGYPMAQPMAPPSIYHPYPAMYSPSPPIVSPTPPPPDTSKDDEKFARLEKILLDQKAEQDAKEAAAKKATEDAAAQAAADKKVADEIAAAASAAAAAATEVAEKKAAEKAAEEAAKAAEEAAKNKAAADEAAEAAAAAAAVTAAATAAAAAAAAATPPPPPPPPEEKKKPIKFKDAVGRKFSFPFHLCNTWMVGDENFLYLSEGQVAH